MQLSKNIHFKKAVFTFFNEYLTPTLLFVKCKFLFLTIVNSNNCFRTIVFKLLSGYKETQGKDIG